MGTRVVSIRHPMPYGNLAEQAVQRFATLSDLKKHKCTIEEMEEYEPHIANGFVVYAGVDYGAILEQAGPPFPRDICCNGGWSPVCGVLLRRPSSA